MISQPFDGDKKKLREFIDNVDVAFELVHPDNHEKLLKFVKAKVTGEARSKLIVRDLTDTWERVKSVLEENYSTKRTLDYYACKMFNSKQGVAESIASWGSRIDTMQTELRDAARRDLTNEEINGAIALVNHLAKACFIQGLSNDRIQTIVRSRGEKILLSTAIEIALEEESAILSQKERGSKGLMTGPKIRCENCNKIGHTLSKCYLKRSGDEPRGVRALNEMRCFGCNRQGHLRRDCPALKGDLDNRPKGRNEGPEGCKKKWVFKGNGPSRNVAAVKRVNALQTDAADTVSLFVEECEGDRLAFLVDSGADVSIVKASLLKGGIDYFPKEKMKVMGVTGEIVSTLGSVSLTLMTEDRKTSHKFQIADENLTLKHDGILGKDFLCEMQAKIDYEKRMITMQDVIVKFDSQPDEKNCPPARRMTHITLPARSEVIVKCHSEKDGEGIVEKREICSGVHMAASLTVSVANECITSLVNSNEEDLQIEVPCVKLIPINGEEFNCKSDTFCSKVEKERINPREVNALEGYQAGSELEREKLLLESLRLEHLNREEKKELINILEKYQDVFYLPGDTLSCTNAIEHAIPTPLIDPAKPINMKPYRLPEAHKEEVDKQVKKMLKDGIIVPSKSAWNSPILAVPKKMDASGEKRWRIVVDYRKLNEVSVGDAYPLPNINEILDQLGKARYFSTLDLASGFHQIPLKREDREKTAFSCPYGHFEFVRTPFGLKGAPPTFQRLMNTVLSGLQGIKCFIYLDDIVIHGNSLQNHNEKLREILDRLRENNLKLHPDKCEFLRKEVNYLGHVISEDGVKPDPEKVRKVKEFPLPKTTKQLNEFIGLAGYYRRFIPEFSKIAKPLHELLKKNVTFNWGRNQQASFKKIEISSDHGADPQISRFLARIHPDDRCK